MLVRPCTTVPRHFGVKLENGIFISVHSIDGATNVDS